jgi:electron transfer flavoprotein alpha subunit
MGGILVFGEMAAQQLAPVSLEVAAAGADLAKRLGEPLLGALMGDAPEQAVESFQGGLSIIYLVQGAHLRPYCADSYVAAAKVAIDACSPSVVLFPHTLETREWVPRLAASLGAGLVTDCVALQVQERDLVATKPVYGGSVLGEFLIRGAPAFATLRAGVFGAGSVEGAGEVVHLEAPQPRPGVTVLEEQAAAGGGPKLKDASVIVSGGRGVGGPDNWHFIEEAAAALDGAVGCSRPVVDSGWVPSVHQVGLSGTTVAPDLYMAVGISGAVQHLAGISAARTVVAINISPEADIFSRADYGVVGDYREVLPAFVERVKQLRQ